MNDNTFNMEIRKFLKTVGVTSQREIEKTVDVAINSSRIQGNETLQVQVTLEIGEIGLNTTIQGTLALE